MVSIEDKERENTELEGLVEGPVAKGTEPNASPVHEGSPESAQDSGQHSGQDSAKKGGLRRTITMGVLALLVLAAAIKGLGAVVFAQTHVETDNAYLTGDLVNISPTVSGTLAELNVADGDYVVKGQLIARLNIDSSSAVLAQAMANLQVAQAQVPQAESELEYTKLSTDAQIRNSQAAISTQLSKTAGSRMQVRLSSDTLRNQIMQAGSQVAEAQAQSAQAQQGVQEAKASLASANLAVETASRNAEAAMASEMSAKAEAVRADKDLVRYAALLRDQAISQQQYDSASAKATSSDADYAAASQRAEAARSQVAQAKSVVQEQRSRVESAIDQASAADKQVQVAKAGLGLALANGTQVGIQSANVHTNESQGSEAAANLASAQAGTQQIALKKKQVSVAKAQLLQAQAAVDHARIDVQDAYLRAPCDGFVVKHTANVGTAISPGQTIVTITRGTAVWVMANFKETQLANVREGQSAQMEVDAYPGQEFRGKVLSILDATGSATTLLPPDNSTGNFTKVVQRVPIKISIEPASADSDQSRGAMTRRLRQGMSVDVTIDTASGSRPSAGKSGTE